MKKLTKILAALVLAATSLVMSGCGDDEVTEILAGPTNTWCRMPVSYKHTDSSDAASLYAYFYFATADKTIGRAELKKGLNVVITAANSSTSSIINGLTDSVFYLKSFDENTETSVPDEDGTALKVVGSRTKWSAIYWGKEELHKKENQSTTAPSQVYNAPIGIESLTNFSLKRLLAQYLLNILDN